MHKFLNHTLAPIVWTAGRLAAGLWGAYQFYEAAHKHLHRNSVLIALGALLVVAIVQFWELNQRNRRILALSKPVTPPPDPDHVERLRTVARNLMNELNGPSLRYTDGTHVGGTLKTIFHKHAPALGVELDAYEAAPERLRLTHNKAKEAAAREIADLNNAAGWNKANLRNAVNVWLERVRRSAEPEQKFESIGPMEWPSGAKGYCVQWTTTFPNGGRNGSSIWEKDFPAPQEGEDVPVPEWPANSEITDLMSRITSSDEYEELIEAREALHSTRAECARRLEQILAAEGFPGKCTDHLCKPSADA